MRLNMPRRPPPKLNYINIFLGSGILALFVALLFAAISLYGGVASMLAGRIVLVISGAVACLGFLFAERCLKKSARFRIALAFFTITILGLGFWRLDAAIVWSKGRHITLDQKQGLASLRDEFPKRCGILIYVPKDSTESQDYGKEIQAGLQMHRAKANLIYEGVLASPVGLVVGVRSSFEPCGYAGEMMSVGMSTLHIPSRFVEGFPRADETVVIIFVGTKPPYD